MTPAANQNPEQIARDQIDKHLAEAGWDVQKMKDLDWSAGQGIAVREYQTDTGPADYVLFVDRRAVGVIEAKPMAAVCPNSAAFALTLGDFPICSFSSKAAAGVAPLA